MAADEWCFVNALMVDMIRMERYMAKNKEPIYMQLYKKLREDIVSGVYPFNSKLPSKRTLADEKGVSLITVEHAYGLLADEGYIETRERSGYYVCFTKDALFSSFEKTSDNAVFMTGTQRGVSMVKDSQEAVSVDHPSFPFSVLSRTMRRVLSDYSDRIMRKPPNSGCTELREALKKYLARNKDMHVETEQIIIGSGAEYLYGMIAELLGRDKVYAIEFPSYKKIEQVYRALELSFEMLPLVRDGIDSRALAETKADVLHTSPFRSFPSGVSASASKRHEYIRWAGSADRFIIEDDFESEFTSALKPVDTLFNLSDKDNVIYMNTFSQTISPALRTGYMVIPKKLLKSFDERIGFYSCTVPTFEQLVLAELISSGDFERNINRIRRSIRKGASRDDK